MRHIAILLIVLSTVASAAATAAGAEATETQCPHCRGLAVLACPDCQFQGRPTGKARCAACNGQRRITCPDCHGSRGIPCTDCAGTGRRFTGRMASRGFGTAPERIYEPCRSCAGTGMRHVGKTHTLPGPCPRCNLPGLATRHLGTIPCPDCKGTGVGGACPACGGTKCVECPHCKPAPTPPATTQPATQPTTQPAQPGGPPRLPEDFTAPSAKAAAGAYAAGVTRAKADYDAAVIALGDTLRRQIAALMSTAVADLDKAMMDATRAGNLDEAIKIRDAAKTLRGKATAIAD